MRVILLLLLTLSAIRASEDLKDIFYGEYKLQEDPSKIVNLLPPTRSQHHPKPCHSSWAFAITSTMSTLFNKAKKGVFPEVVLSPQMLIHTRPESVKFSCAGTPDFQIEPVLENLKLKGVSDEGCNNYFSDDARRTDKLAECMDCHNDESVDKDTKCDFVPYSAHKLNSFTKIISDKTEQSEIIKDLKEKVLKSLFENGPLVCKISHSSKLFEKRNSEWEIYEEKDKNEESSWVSLVMYSETRFATKQVVSVTTSLGDNVGYYGHITMEIGENQNPLDVFSNCYELVIDEVPTPVKASAGQSSFDLLRLDKGVKKTGRGNSQGKRLRVDQGYKPSLLSGEINKGIHPSESVTPINWQNYKGRNYLTYVKNQHIPTYCGSCWAQAAVSVLADRVMIGRVDKNQVFPKINLSVQSIINCKRGGSCFGGDPTLVFQKAEKWRIPIESCQPYESKNPESWKCETSKVCSLPIPGKDALIYQNYAGVTVKKWSRVQGSEFIKEALKSGPVTCSFMVTEEFVKFSRIPGVKLNIWTKTEDFIDLNHAISVVGWDVQDGMEYWIARNSWGKEWGYDGFFYMELGKNVLGIESDCATAEVEFHESMMN